MSGVWPDGTVFPKLTQETAERAFRRLYRFAMGEAYIGSMVHSRTKFMWQDGHSNYEASRKDWPTMVAYLARGFIWACNNPSKDAQLARETSNVVSNNDTQMGERAYHAAWVAAKEAREDLKFRERFEKKLAREVIRRGWLEGKGSVGMPTRKRKPQPSEYERKLAALDKRIANWETKWKRADKALKKLNKVRRAMVAYQERKVNHGR